MTTNNCPKCGLQFSGNECEGLCPSCLLRDAIPQTMGAKAKTKITLEELNNRLPDFEVIELIGEGGMGAVYKARQLSLDRLAAVKVIRPVDGDDPAFAERFVREARTLAKLTHPNIVAIYQFGQCGDIYYLAMEYVDGVDLRQLQDSQRITPEEAISIVPAICEALQFAHQNGVVHRDIKPENILLDQQGKVKIADFGLAKLTEHELDDASLTRTQQVLGTPRYMSPEQLERPVDVDHRTDIYSLGVVFYELLTGELPLGRFDVPSAKSTASPRLDGVVLKALEKDPQRRYQSAAEFETGIHESQLVPPIATEPPQRVHEPKPTPSRPRDASEAADEGVFFPYRNSGNPPLVIIVCCAVIFLASFFSWGSFLGQGQIRAPMPSQVNNIFTQRMGNAHGTFQFQSMPQMVFHVSGWNGWINFGLKLPNYLVV
ncbi:MAG: serine/threonine protein kinase, partial [Pirellulaceae bacterium]